jgi:hypothetical protein
MLRKTIVAAFGALFATAPVATRAANFDPGFDGAWAGVIKIIDTTLYNPTPLPADLKTAVETMKSEIAIEIDQGAARVYIKTETGWDEVKQGSFDVVIHKTNAVVAAITANIAKDKSAGWVETWNFTLTRKDDKALYAYWVRVVNNYHLAVGEPYARFMVSGVAELVASGPIPGPGRYSVSDAREGDACLPSTLSCGDGDKLTAPAHE